jgi:CheY-like chemotaxis protein
VTEISPLLGLRILLLEDNLIVALEAEDLLRSLGAVSVTAVSSISGATSLFDANPFDFAVLDINLGFENSLSFADRLRRAKVPFVFASGYGDQSVSGESRISELIVSKPYDKESLSAAIALTLYRQGPVVGGLH